MILLIKLGKCHAQTKRLYAAFIQQGTTLNTWQIFLSSFGKKRQEVLTSPPPFYQYSAFLYQVMASIVCQPAASMTDFMTTVNSTQQ